MGRGKKGSRRKKEEARRSDGDEGGSEGKRGKESWGGREVK